MKMRFASAALCIVLLLNLVRCKDSSKEEPEPTPRDLTGFLLGADLSYVNQVVDHGGVYKDNGTEKSPYQIFHDHGANLVRVRLWHNPLWTKDAYGESATQMYSDLSDVEKTIQLAKSSEMQVLLDFHYSDTWADPSHQDVPAAWVNVRAIADLKDSVYNYTYKVLQHLKSKSLLPEYVQIGNETNCGMFFTNAPDGFPTCNVCNGSWANMGLVVDAGIKAVRDVSATSSTKTKVVLHVADPKNVEWWFDNITTSASVTDFDVVGFSYYPLWHKEVKIDDLSEKVSLFKSKYQKSVMVLETAYPWTKNTNDTYTNLMGTETPITGYPFTDKGQSDFMIKMTQEVLDGGGQGIIYWEPAWISSNMKDQWGTGSAWENCTFFDFNGNPLQALDYPTATYH